jgi:hypothetical protein
LAAKGSKRKQKEAKDIKEHQRASTGIKDIKKHQKTSKDFKRHQTASMTTKMELCLQRFDQGKIRLRVQEQRSP